MCQTRGEKQGVENLPVEIQAVENQGQLNTNTIIKRNPLRSDQVSINQSPSDSEMIVERQNNRLMNGYVKEQDIYTEVVKQNIHFDYFGDWLQDTDETEKIVQMIMRQICSRKPTERICEQEFLGEIVKSAMLKVDIIVLQNAIEQIKYTDNVRNYEGYLISTLFNEANNRHFK